MSLLMQADGGIRAGNVTGVKACALQIALTPGSASTLAVANGPVQRIDVPTHACTCLTQLGRCRCRVLVEVDRIRSAHIEPEPLHQRRTGGITLLATGVHLHLRSEERR